MRDYFFVKRLSAILVDVSTFGGESEDLVEFGFLEVITKMKI